MKRKLICKYCEKEYQREGHAKGVCGTCASKVTLLPKYIEARDALRRKLGLKPMGYSHYSWW